jgi:hypothetical protein
MILVDTNQFLIARYMTWVSRSDPCGKKPGLGAVPGFDDFAIRARASLRTLLDNLGRSPDEPAFLCLESPRVWRTERFPYYRWSRIQSRIKGDTDWQLVHSYLEAAIGHMRPEFPAIQVENAEGDDVIAAVCEKFGSYVPAPGKTEILILSSDKDFRQLLRYWNVQIFNPITSKYTTLDGTNPERILQEHILSGDSGTTGDGVPNFLSPDDCFVTKTRQRSLTQEMKNRLLAGNPEELLDGEDLERYRRNKMLIDLSQTPEEIKTEAINQVRGHILSLINTLQSRNTRTSHGNISI